MVKAILESLNNFIIEVNKTNKTNNKIEITKKYPDLKKVFVYVNDKQITFGITSKAYKKFIKSKKQVTPKIYNHLYDLLDDLAARKITGHLAAASLQKYISQFPEYQDIILRIIDKNLKTKTNTKLVNKVFPGLINVFEVALAEKYKEKKLKDGIKYYISRKLDGVRCICFYENYGKSIRFYSRAGNEFLDKNGKCTLTKLYEPLRKLFKGIESIVLDGEICVINNGIEDFQSVIKQIRKNVNNPRYYVFDILETDEFKNGESKMKFDTRYKRLQMFENKVEEVKILEQVEMSKKSFERMKKVSAENGWEGLMIKKNGRYKRGRSFDLMKYKTFFDDEFLVKEIITGPFRVISKKTGLEETIETMTAVIIDFYNTKVGSGFSLEERDYFYKNPSEIIGKKITVQYFEKTKNQENDDLSLRFPTYKGLRNYE